MSNDEKPSVSFGTVQGDAVIGDQHKGDIVQGDKDQSQGKTEIAGDMHGDIKNTNIQGQANIERVKDQMSECCNALSQVFQPMQTPPELMDSPPPVEAEQPVPEPLDFGEDFEPVAIDNDQHPDALFLTSVQLGDRIAAGEDVTEDEVAEVESGWKTMLATAGKYAGVALKTAGPPFMAAVSDLADSPPQPWSMISKAVGAVISG